MASENEILEELQALQSPLAAMPRTMPFAVPEGYFDALDSALLAGIAAAESDDLTLDLPKETPFLLPKGYFKESASQIVSSAALPETDNAYTVPSGYFEDFPSKVIEAIRATEKPAKRKTILIAFPQWRAVQWAAAAMLMLAIGLGSYKIYYTPDRKASHQLARVDKDAIGQYMVQSIDATNDEALVVNAPAATEIKNLSSEEITRYLDETGWEDASSVN